MCCAIEKLEAEPGATVEFNDVLLIADGDNVHRRQAAAQGRQGDWRRSRSTAKGDKVSIVKFRRRKHYLRQKNHRQHYTQVRVTEISAP